MNTKSVVLVVACVSLAVLLLLGSRLAQGGALQCLRSRRTTDIHLCLSCHDGSLAFNLQLEVSHAAPNNAAGEHPVAVSYAGAYARRPTEFVPPGLLDSQVQLINGEVQCLTCHTTNEKGNWVPLKPLGNRSLCLSCHRK